MSRRPAIERQAAVTGVERASASEQPLRAPTVTVGIPTFNRASLLREAIESVLTQTYPDFQLIVSDNASTDETADVVASLADPRLEYVRAEENIGMIGNFTRLIALARTDLFMLLPDDDRLYPDYLRSVTDVMRRYPRVGLAQTAFDEIDIDSNVRRRAPRPGGAPSSCTVEPGRAFLERSMTSSIIFLSTATFRTRALREAGGMIESEEPCSDVPLFMRIARTWDIAHVDRPLVAFRVHEQTATVRLAPSGQDEADVRNRLLTYGQIMFDKRMGFLDDAGLPGRETSRYRSLASLRFLADQAGLGAPRLETWRSFARIVRLHPRILGCPLAVRFVAAQCGGRMLRRAAARGGTLAARLRSSPFLRPA